MAERVFNPWVWGLLPVAAVGALGGWWSAERAAGVKTEGRPVVLPAESAVERQKPVEVEGPAGPWMEQVRRAVTDEEFAGLMVEMEQMFPASSDFVRLDAARRWLLGCWVMKNPEGAAAYVVSRKNEMMETALGAVVGELAPESAKRLMFGPLLMVDSGPYFRMALKRAMGAHHPALLLELMGHWNQGGEEMRPAIASLAKTDPVAAAGYWKKLGKGEPNALLAAVVEGWAGKDPAQARAWLETLETAAARRTARHAWLAAMADKDLPSARKTLAEWDASVWRPEGAESVRDPEELDRRDGRLAVLAEMAKEDLSGAVREWERMVKEGVVKDAKQMLDPFGSSTEAILTRGMTEAVRSTLPKAPAAFFAKLEDRIAGKDLPEGFVNDLANEVVSWQVVYWSPVQLREALGQLMNQAGVSNRKEWISQVAGQLVEQNPDGALDFLEKIPASQRKAIAGEFSRAVANEPDLTQRFVSLLPSEAWTADIGSLLAKNIETGSAVLSDLADNEGARQARQEFTKQWAQADPEAAAQWVAGLRPEQGATAGAAGLAKGWASYDETSASEWTAALPPGPVRDGAAAGLAEALAATDREAAWKWAAAVAEPNLGLKAMGQLASTWGNGAPPEFRQLYLSALTSAGRNPAEVEAAVKVLEAPVVDPFK